MGRARRFSVFHGSMLPTGIPAPDFTLPDQDGTPVTLSDLRGSPVVLYFYPKAATPGCTTQACGVRDARRKLAAVGAHVLGISRDSEKTLARWHGELRLNFPLLSDSDHAVAEAYDVWVDKSMFGRPGKGMSRTTYVIDPEGRIAHVIPKVKAETHAEDVLAVLGELSAA
jgi:peroxiredoxin Q/BCP